ncbi:GNAT family N-acetyltransferase [Roseibium polysiphoniae]|uniref:GNAT family N-acetyltransferase n=1 Tax=Roseibium polysiphoniae TaxID=2571221 RepID=UPI0032983299
MAATGATALASDPVERLVGAAPETTSSNRQTVELRLARLDDFASASGFITQLGEDRFSLPYHEASWIESWQSSFGETEHCQPVLVAGFLEEQAAFFLPLALQQNGPLRVLSFLGQNKANQSTGLWRCAAVDAVEPAVLRRHLSALAETLKADLLQLANLPEYFGESPNPLCFGELVQCPSPVFIGPLSDDFDDLFRTSHSKAARKKLAKKQKSLEAADNFQIVCAETEAEIVRGLNAFLEQRAVRAAATGIPNVFTGEKEKLFLETLLKSGQEREQTGLNLWWLECEGEIRATYLSCRSGDRLIGYANSISHDDMTAHSPGVVLLKEIIARACADPGLHCLDLGLGDERYKRSWSEAVALFDSYTPLTLKGKLAFFAFSKKQALKVRIRKSETLWPLVRKMRALKARVLSS